jgi:hypothetical protein
MRQRRLRYQWGLQGFDQLLASKATRQFGSAALAIYLLIFSPVAFHSKSPLVFYGFDGIYLLIAAVMQKTWSVSDWYFTSTLCTASAAWNCHSTI